MSRINIAAIVFDICQIFHKNLHLQGSTKISALSGWLAITKDIKKTVYLVVDDYTLFKLSKKKNFKWQCQNDKNYK